MPYTAEPGIVLSRPGNIVPGFGVLPGHVAQFTGVSPGMVGDTYDIAIGYPDPVSNAVVMVGYVLTNQGQWQESTNLQDEQHLVQIASPSSSDRFARYPKVSQGDWSGGERQLIFIDPTKYYSSTQLDCSRPGHLRNWGLYTTITSSTLSYKGRALSSDSSNVYWLTTTPSIQYVASGGGAVTTTAITGAAVDIVRGSDHIYYATASGVWQFVLPSTKNQVSNEVVAAGTNGPGVMGTFNGSLYYVVTAASVSTVKAAAYPFPGAGAGTLVDTVPQMEGLIGTLSDSSQGLLWATATTPSTYTSFFTFDGVNPNFIGKLPGVAVIDSCEANGVVYVLCAAQNPIGQWQPVIVQVSGSTISLFDDYRVLDPVFQANTTLLGGRLDSDGVFLYLFYPGLDAKQYSLRTQGVYDVGLPSLGAAANQAHLGTGLSGVGFAEVVGNDTTHVYLAAQQTNPNVDGTMTTSWFDFDTPLVDKLFTSIEFVMNTPVDPSALSVSYGVDSSNAFQPLTTLVSTSFNSLVCYLPRSTIGTRVRFRFTLLHAATSGTPDVQLISVAAKLARVWQLTVACRRESIGARLGDHDPQNLTSTQLIANIRNIYDLADGQCFVYVPDPTITDAAFAAGRGVAVGVSQQSAILQDYTWTTAPGVGPGYKQEPGEGPFAVEGDVALVLAGSL